MKLIHLTTAAAAVALLGGAAYAQQPQPPAKVTSGSVTGDWNGAHSPPDEKQYQEKVTVPVGSPPAASTDVTAPPAGDTSSTASTSTTTTTDTSTAAPSATSTASNTSATFTNLTVTNGPVPDTPQNRKKYGQPLSHAGKMTAARGN
jgi:hypothetical protein